MLNKFENLPKNDLPFRVIWIHGAGQSPLTFNYIRSRLPNWDSQLLSYKCQNGFYNNLNSLKGQVIDSGPLFLVGHSLGGLYSLHLLKTCDVVGAVSISTPFGGSFTADWARLFVPGYQLFKDIGRRSLPIIEGRGIPINIPWTQIVSTDGHVPYHGSKNDGVVTIDSMEERKNDMNLQYVNTNHFETVCSDDVVQIVADSIINAANS